jgi:hypothetical protein
MIATVGQRVFDNHFKFDSASYYETTTPSNDALVKTLTKVKKTKGKIKFINVRYTFYIKKFESPFVWTGIVFDKELKLKKAVDTSFIPKFILQGSANDFLTANDILKISEGKFIKKGIKPIETTLTYDHYKKVYVWSALNVINEWKDAYNNIQREVELLEVNAISGQLINFYPNALQGKVY